MENIDKNADILTILDGYKTYAAEYEERKKKEEEEQKRRRAEEEKVVAENLKRRNIQDEIAETLRKIKEQEAEDAKVTFFDNFFVKCIFNIICFRNLMMKEKEGKKRKGRRKR